jgi:hypothetical protein
VALNINGSRAGDVEHRGASDQEPYQAEQDKQMRFGIDAGSPCGL